MPFQRLDLARVASASTGAPAMWLYLSETEALADVLNADYFGVVAPQLRVNDIICCRLTDRNCWLRVLSVDAGLDLVVTEQVDFISPSGPEGQNLVNWRVSWVPTTYEKNDQVKDDGWLMIANKTTVDTAAPQPSGSPSFDLPDVPLWTDEVFTDVVASGHTYTLIQSGWVNAIQVWAPVLDAETEYRIIVSVVTDPANPEVIPIDDPTLKSNDWTTVFFDPTPFAAGTIISVILQTLSASGGDAVNGLWVREIDSNNGAPSTGSWRTRSDETQLRINKTDDNAIDRTADLSDAGAGSTFIMAQQDDPNKSMTFQATSAAIDQGTFFEWSTIQTDTGQGGQPDVDKISTVDINKPIFVSTDYKELAGEWPGNNPSWATIEGVLQLGGVNQAVPLNAYGVRMNFQPAYISPDWDLVTSGGKSASTLLGIASFRPSEVLIGFDLADQNPPGLDTPVTVKVGGTIGTAADPVSMVNDIVQINEDGVYGFRYIMSVSRTTSLQEAFIFIRARIDGVQSGNPISAVLDNDEMTIPLEFTFTAFFPAGTTVDMEIYRDSQGTDNGGLKTRASNIGWGQSPSAAIRVTKFS